MRSKSILAAGLMAGLIAFAACAAPASAQLPRGARPAFAYPPSYDFYADYTTPYFTHFAAPPSGYPSRYRHYPASLIPVYGAGTASGADLSGFALPYPRQGLFSNYGHGLSDYAAPYYGQGLYTPSNVPSYAVPYIIR